MNEAWRTVAACRNQMATMFDSGRQTEARSLCDSCPVEQLCLWASMREEDPSHRYGMAGGMNAGQRAALARRLPFVVIEAAYEAALAAWQLRNGVAGAELAPTEGGGRQPESCALSPTTSAGADPAPTKENDLVTDQIIAAVAAAFGIAPEQLLATGRTRHVVDARQVAMYVLREVRGLSYPAIGAAVGGRDHTTVMHGVERVRARMAEQPALRRGVERLVASAGTDGAAADRGVVLAPEPVAGVDAVLGEVARVCGVRVEQLCGRSRIRHVAEARQVAMYVLRELRQLSYPAIGQAVGGRDHSTAMHAVERVRCAMTQPGVRRDQVEAAMAALSSVPAAA
ncbi:MAG: helix-turn-helix domain-containing protein [Acidimicrobiales bacterium]